MSYIGYATGDAIIRSEGSEKDNTVRLSSDPTMLNEVVITATRTPKALKDVPMVTRVISAEEIGKTDATNIQDLLTEELPGLEFDSR